VELAMSDPTLPESAAENPLPDLTGRTIGDFQVLRKLGQGGMGQVYLARQLSLKREVALKILRDDLAANKTALKRFQAEAEAVARLTHANIVQVFAVGEHEGLRYMALEFVDGRNLRDYLARKGPPELALALSIIRQVAAALQRASEHGIVHRDIKPENILITKKAEVKVTDFGLSRYFAREGEPLNLTQSGITLGTPLYMSPEQVQGQVVDHRSDIYSLGVTSYHLLSGQPPFRGKTAFEVAVQHVQAEAVPLSVLRPDLPADLCAIVERMMAKRPEDRYQTARDIIRDLARVQRGLPVAADSPSRSGGTAVLLSGVSGSRSQAVLATGGGLTGAAMYGPGSYLPPFPPPASSLASARRLAGVSLLVILAVAGWYLPEVFPEVGETAAAPQAGLPLHPLPSPLISRRERELQATIQNRASPQSSVVDAMLELGLLYLREGRLDDADRIFAEMQLERAGRSGGNKAVSSQPASLAGRIGHAIVLAHRDQAKQSNEILETIVSGPPRLPPIILEKFLMSHPDFAEAVSNALQRNMENLQLDRLPERLEWLRTPSGILQGPPRPR
jgi:serine/threonine protein kinase